MDCEPRNAVIVHGYAGMGQFLANVYGSLTQGKDCNLIWPQNDDHTHGVDCPCPKLIFTLRPKIQAKEVSYAENGPVD